MSTTTKRKNISEKLLEIKKNNPELFINTKAEEEKTNQLDGAKKAAQEIYKLYKSCVHAGFSEEQAWEITKIAIKTAIDNSYRQHN